MGGCAMVVRAKHTKTGEAFALKVISKAKTKKSLDRKAVAFELRAMALGISSPFLVKCHGAFETADEVFMALELMEGGDLFGHLMRRAQKTDWGFPESQARVLLAEIVVAVQHLHSAGYAHRDIKVSYNYNQCQ